MSISTTQESVEAFRQVYQSLASGVPEHKYLKVGSTGIFFKDYWAEVVDKREERSSLKSIALCVEYLQSKLGTDSSTLASRNILLLSVQKIKEMKGVRLAGAVSQGKVCGIGLCCESRQIQALNAVELELMSNVPQKQVGTNIEDYQTSTDTPVKEFIRSNHDSFLVEEEK